MNRRIIWQPLLEAIAVAFVVGLVAVLLGAPVWVAWLVATVIILWEFSGERR